MKQANILLIIGLAEVENDTVLKDLVESNHLNEC